MASLRTDLMLPFSLNRIAALLSALFMSALILGAPARASAQEPPAPPPPELADPPAGYTAAIEEAVEFSSEENWRDARVAFQKAHGLFPNARTLRGIGIVSYQMNDYREAYRHLLASLLEKRRALTAAQDKEVRDLLKKTEKLLGRYTTRHLPRDAEYLVDEHPAQLEDNGTLLVTRGRHTVRVTSEGRTAEESLTVNGGEVGPLPIELTAAPPKEMEPEEPETTETEEPPPAPVPGDSSSEPTARSPWPVVAMATGGAFILAGAAMFIVGQTDIAKVESASGGTEWHTLEKRNNRAPVLTGLGAGLVGVGAAIGITGVALQVSGGPQESGFSLGVSGQW